MGVGFTAWLSAANTVCSEYSPLVPISPNTTPSDPRINANDAPRRSGLAPGGVVLWVVLIRAMLLIRVGAVQ